MASGDEEERPEDDPLRGFRLPPGYFESLGIFDSVARVAREWSVVQLPKIEALRMPMIPALQINTAKWFADTLAPLQRDLNRLAVGRHVLGNLALSLDSLQEIIRATTAPLLERVNAALPDVARSLQTALPENLASTRADWDLELLDKLMLDEGLPIAWIPSAPVLERVLRAPTPAARRAIYGKSWLRIVSDADELLSRCSSPDLQQYVRFARKAVDGLRDGHHELAQAMLMNTFDTVLRQQFPNDIRVRLTNTKTPLDTDDLTLRVYFAWCSVWSVYGQYWPSRGDMIPRRLSRHASAHGVSRRQYTRINSVLALAHLTGLLWFLDSHYSRGRAI